MSFCVGVSCISLPLTYGQSQNLIKVIIAESGAWRQLFPFTYVFALPGDEKPREVPHL